MKKALVPVLAVWAALALSVSCRKGAPSAVSFKPSQPQAGRPVTVVYDPSGTPLAQAAEVEMIVYSYIKKMPTAAQVAMTREKTVWTAVYEPEPQSRGAILKFQSGEVTDSNRQKGYVLPIYDDRGILAAGHLAGLAEAYASWGDYTAGLSRDHDLAMTYFEREFAAHPEMKREYLSPYLSSVARLKKKDAESIILAELDTLSVEPGLNRDDLDALVYWYNREKKLDLARPFALRLLATEPKGEFAQSQRFEELYQAQDPARKAELARSFEKDFPGSPLMPQAHYFIVTSYLSLGDWPRAKAYLESTASAAASGLYLRLAGELAQKPETIKDGEALARRAVELARQEIVLPKDPKPQHQIEREWKAQMEANLGECLDTLGAFLLKAGRKEEAQKALEEAVTLTKNASPEVNEHYARALDPVGEHRVILDRIPGFIRQGQSTPAMKAILKDAFIADKGGESGWTEYLAGLESAARDTLKSELDRQVLDLPAPVFTLSGLDGSLVSLADFKGQTVVLDFWAAWCGPCLASFPAMSRLVEKYKDDAQVKFLFVNSWERTEDKKKSASDFIAANSYAFQVLLDVNDAVIDDYRVDGIPTKFIIDKNGRVRFKSVGYSGSPDRLVDEVSLMIEMIR